MMTAPEREIALKRMEATADGFYRAAVSIGVHPFIEFAGLMNEYIKCARVAHAEGVDFTDCNTHTGKDLPMPGHSVDYINEKLECIFTGRSVMDAPAGGADVSEVPETPKAAEAEQPSTFRLEEWRRLRVGEIIQAGDMQVVHGNLCPVSEVSIGFPVLGERGARHAKSHPDCMYRRRKRMRKADK